jgi:hypothetical protein
MIKKVIILASISLIFLFGACKKKADANSEQHSAISNPAQPGISEMDKRVVPADGKYPVMTFSSNEHDFGSIQADSKVNYSFTFKNTGQADLIISRAFGSCGCTIPEYPKDPIKPGESGKIDVSFNSANKHGNQQKSVTIYTNTKAGAESLYISASIKEKIINTK